MWAITIDDERIQEDTDTYFEEKLTENELERVKSDICLELNWVIQEAVKRALDFRELLKRNKGAKNIFPHYQVFHRNVDAYKPDFKPCDEVFITKDDAEEFMSHEKSYYMGEWKIELVNTDNSVVKSE